jgi:hypothetical protein
LLKLDIGNSLKKKNKQRLEGGLESKNAGWRVNGLRETVF